MSSVFHVKVFYGGMESSNIFYVQNGAHAFLVDAGMVETAEAAMEAIRNGALSSPEAIILTHSHIDHVAGIAAVRREIGGVPIFASPRTARALNDGDQITTGAALFGLPLPSMTVRELPVGMSNSDSSDFRPSLPFLEGIEVFSTPGHTEGSIVLFHRESRSLFSGDTVFANGGVGRWDLPTGNLSELIKSLKFLRGLDVEALYPGHGAVVEVGGKFHIEESYRAIEAYI